MKMYRDEKTLGLQRVILFIESFANVTRFGFYSFIRAFKFDKLFNTKRNR